jgi:hypothetical protein
MGEALTLRLLILHDDDLGCWLSPWSPIVSSAGKNSSHDCMLWKRTNPTIHSTYERSVCMESWWRRSTLRTALRRLGG